MSSLLFHLYFIPVLYSLITSKLGHFLRPIYSFLHPFRSVYMTYKELQLSSTEDDILANTLYLFLLMVVFAIVVGGFSFGVREYRLNKLVPETAPIRSTEYKPNKAISLTSLAITESSASNNSETKEAVHGLAKREEQPDIIDSQSHSEPNSHNITTKEVTSPIEYNYIPSSALAPINLNIELSESSPFNGGSIGNYLNQEFQVEVPAPKLMYSQMQLLEIHQYLKVYQWNTNRLININETNFGELISRIVFPMMCFETVYDAEKSIISCTQEIKKVDIVSGMLSMVKLFSIGSPHQDNCNYFVESFANLVLELVESGLLLNYLEQGSELFKEATVNMLLCFCWSQFNNNIELQEGVKHQLSAWNLRKPNMLNIATVFRLLSNMKLGLRSIELDEAKVDAMLTIVCDNLQCNEYLTIMPLIGKVIRIGQHESIVVYYYQLAMKVLEKHIDCCMRNYVNDDKHDNDIKVMVQEGIGLKQQTLICHNAYKIYYFVLLKGCAVESWLSEAGQDEKNARVSRSASRLMEFNKRLSTPGSWDLNSGSKTSELNRSPSLQRFEF